MNWRLWGNNILNWTVYILECGDGSLYTGITNNFPNRLEAHEAGKGAKYTKGRSPFNVLYLEEVNNRSEASKREMQIKTMSRADKIKLAGL